MIKTCEKHGTHGDWAYRKSQWWYICRKCRRERKRTERIERNHQRLLRMAGKAIADSYRQAASSGADADFRYYLNRKNPSLLKFTREQLRRIRLLNSISGEKDENHLGWACALCGTYHDHPSFFDVDHIKAVVDGGEEDFGNLQILCPSCHKCKTHGIRNWREETLRISSPEIGMK